MVDPNGNYENLKYSRSFNVYILLNTKWALELVSRPSPFPGRCFKLHPITSNSKYFSNLASLISKLFGIKEILTNCIFHI